MGLLAVVLWLVNLGISAWNAYAAGEGWAESKHAGGFARLVAWAGAAMSGLGFAWCYLTLLAVVGAGLSLLSGDLASAALSLGYIVIMLGVLSSGAVIMLDSWANAYRQRGIGSFGVAGYNTFAEMYNGYNAVRGLPAAFHEVVSMVRGGDRDRNLGASGVVLGLVLIVLLAGVTTISMIIQHVAGSGGPIPAQGSPGEGYALVPTRKPSHALLAGLRPPAWALVRPPRPPNLSFSRDRAPHPAAAPVHALGEHSQQRTSPRRFSNKACRPPPVKRGIASRAAPTPKSLAFKQQRPRCPGAPHIPARKKTGRGVQPRNLLLNQGGQRKSQAGHSRWRDRLGYGGFLRGLHIPAGKKAGRGVQPRNYF